MIKNMKKEMKISYIGWSFLQTGIIIPINYNLFHPWTNWKESENMHKLYDA